MTKQYGYIRNTNCQGNLAVKLPFVVAAGVVVSGFLPTWGNLGSKLNEKAARSMIGWLRIRVNEKVSNTESALAHLV